MHARSYSTAKAGERASEDDHLIGIMHSGVILVGVESAAILGHMSNASLSLRRAQHNIAGEVYSVTSLLFNK